MQLRDKRKFQWRPEKIYGRGEKLSEIVCDFSLSNWAAALTCLYKLETKTKNRLSERISEIKEAALRTQNNNKPTKTEWGRERGKGTYPGPGETNDTDHQRRTGHRWAWLPRQRQTGGWRGRQTWQIYPTAIGLRNSDLCRVLPLPCLHFCVRRPSCCQLIILLCLSNTERAKLHLVNLIT